MKPDNIEVHKWKSDTAPDEAAVRKILDAEGLQPYRWSNGPGDVYAAHSHTYHKVIYVINGSITFGFKFFINFLPGENRINRRKPWHQTVS